MCIIFDDIFFFISCLFYSATLHRARVYDMHTYIQRLYVRSEIIISWVSFRDCVCANRASLGQVREYARHTVEIMEIGQRAMHRSVMTVYAIAPMAGTTGTGTIGTPARREATYMENTSGIICHFDAIRPAENAEPRFTDVYLSDFTAIKVTSVWPIRSG